MSKNESGNMGPQDAGGNQKKDPNSSLYEGRGNKKLIRVVTVLAYMFSVSFVAIVLSAYYLFLWQPPNPRLLHAQHLKDPQVQFLVDHPPVVLGNERNDFINHSQPWIKEIPANLNLSQDLLNVNSVIEDYRSIDPNRSALRSKESALAPLKNKIEENRSNHFPEIHNSTVNFIKSTQLDDGNKLILRHDDISTSAQTTETPAVTDQLISINNKVSSMIETVSEDTPFLENVTEVTRAFFPELPPEDKDNVTEINYADNEMDQISSEDMAKLEASVRNDLKTDINGSKAESNWSVNGNTESSEFPQEISEDVKDGITEAVFLDEGLYRTDSEIEGKFEKSFSKGADINDTRSDGKSFHRGPKNPKSLQDVFNRSSNFEEIGIQLPIPTSTSHPKPHPRSGDSFLKKLKALTISEDSNAVNISSIMSNVEAEGSQLLEDKLESQKRQKSNLLKILTEPTKLQETSISSSTMTLTSTSSTTPVSGSPQTGVEASTDASEEEKYSDDSIII
ncbi:uncharacterized protein LOC105695292 [Orussus abietinus]|uniref:uncharacterized protein LOC105695292 n=1 Tax=Orussus abietinus TaxID=222816 RepID=UPI0006269B11|nr:uncharacterized protein LOC105695292 [Orussus abietinus]XP_012272158.1 uncharacterized protein LOC105695292 [Orussus abietinus]XP_012272159.1 uncharacterized protein LOC105695292 [Orussus abietinus]